MSLAGRGHQAPTSLCPSESNAGIESPLISKLQIKSRSQTLRKPIVITSVKNQSEGPEPIHLCLLVNACPNRKGTTLSICTTPRPPTSPKTYEQQIETPGSNCQRIGWFGASSGWAYLRHKK